MPLTDLPALPRRTPSPLALAFAPALASAVSLGLSRFCYALLPPPLRADPGLVPPERGFDEHRERDGLPGRCPVGARGAAARGRTARADGRWPGVGRLVDRARACHRRRGDVQYRGVDGGTPGRGPGGARERSDVGDAPRPSH